MIQMISSLLLGFFIFTTCLGAQEGPVSSPIEEAEQKSSLEDNIRAQIAGNNAFGMDLYNRLREKGNNIICSPYCLSSALVLPCVGSAGATRTQFQTILRFLSQEENLLASFAWLNQHFTTPWYSGPNETRLYIGNSLWIQQDIRLLPAFAAQAAKYFKSSLKQVDFIRNSESSRININNWVREKTQGHIEHLIKPGEISSNTRLVVVSSLFMKAVWEHAFDPVLTSAHSFFVNKFNTVSMPMMTTTANFPFYQSDSYTLIELPYRGGEGSQTQFSLLVFLPKDLYNLSKVENMVLSQPLENLLQPLRIDRVIVTFPKFKISSEFELNTTLQQMGLVEAFNENADFSKIDGSRDLSISNVIQKAYLSIDEKGTEAVAATAVTINRTAYEPQPATVFLADHPFLFMIIDRSINALLFIGRFVSP
jgi:serpin B